MVDDGRPIRAQAGSGPEVTQDDPFGPLRAGMAIGKYEISETLGQGGFGITYRARDTQLRRDVAIKEYLPTSFAMRQGGTTVLPRSTQTAEDFRWGRERFLDEARTLATLEEAPGIVNVYDFMEANGTAYMVMALVRGETIEVRLKRERRLPQPAIEQFLYPLLDGLEKVHEAGFLHRDIKPANILLDPMGRPTLIDFGASRVALQGRTQALTAVYTPGYAAFEQSTSAKQGPPTDIYALAATLYHCITGRQPPAASDRMIDDRLVPAIEAGKGRYAPSLLAAIDAGLKLKAADRPQNIGDWRRILSGIAAGHSVGTPTREMDEPETRRMTEAVGARPRPRGGPLVWIAAGVVASVLAGGGAWVMLRSPAETSQEALRRAEAEAQRQVALATRLRKEEEARRQAEEAEHQRAAAAEAGRRAEAEAARKAAEEKAVADAAARRQAEEEAARRRTQEARAAEAQREAEAAAARKAAEEKATVEAAQRRKAEEEEAARRRGEDQARADAEVRRKAEEDARRTAEEKARLDQAAREKAAAEAQARADAEAKRKAEEEVRHVAEEKAKAEAEAKRQAEAGEAALRLSIDDRKRVQVALTALGYNTQGSDGTFGPRTRQMVTAWQKTQGAPETGYLTAVQLTALRQQAAPAIARFDEEQKKAEEEKRKTEEEAKRKQQEEEAKKRAEEEKRRQQQQQQPVAAVPSGVAAATPSTNGASFDGVYFGKHCSGPTPDMVSCWDTILTVQGGVGTYRWVAGRCKQQMASVSVRIDAGGALSGTASGFDKDCLPNTGPVWGRVVGKKLSIESRGMLRANLEKR